MGAVFPIVLLGGIADFIGINSIIVLVGVVVAIVFLLGRANLARVEYLVPAGTGA